MLGPSAYGAEVIARRAVVASVAVVSLVGLGACSAGTKQVSSDEVEAQVAKQLAEEVNQPEPDISCPTDLKAEVGASIECELSVEGDDDIYPVTVTVTKVKDDGTVDFDAEVGEEPKR